MNKEKIITLAFSSTLLLLICISLFRTVNDKQHLDIKVETRAAPEFDGARAMLDIEYQLSLGPRYYGSSGHTQIQYWLKESLESSGWQVTFQNGSYMDVPITNIIAKRGSGATQILLGAHYDTRIYADKDPLVGNRRSPVPGANDGASGVAVLLEIARVIPVDFPTNLSLVFFDAEDNGNIPGWDWIMGSQLYVQKLNESPDIMVLVDMVGDRELNIYLEKNSDPALSAEIWRTAAELGYGDNFIPQERYAIIDDHIPFIRAGIPSVNIIDFDYPYHHTTDDTLDKVSSQSIQIVGETLISWLGNYHH